jgi:hypothetical protein
MGKALLVTVVVALSILSATALAASSSKHTLKAALTGAAEVPQEGQTGTGTASITLNDETGRVCWRFTNLRNLGGAANAAHIHRGRTGVAGPVVIPLGATYRARGCTTASDSLIESIIRNPGRYYVNVHNATYPAGATRGQLRKP